MSDMIIGITERKDKVAKTMTVYLIIDELVKHELYIDLLTFSRAELTGTVKETYEKLLQETRHINEHPEWWLDYPCMCQLCCSYGD